MAAPAPRPPALAGALEVDRLANGLRVCRVVNAQAPLVSTALFYRVGCRDEPRGRGGLAHFLEHMMFKGSAGYGPGEIDRLTQALGGSNNAFTSHDLTAYHFTFAADRWPAALAIEADRMRGLTLDPEAVASERQVILEEIAMYRDDPWDALELDVQAELWGDHPYGRPVLGTPEELEGEGAEQLAGFHRRFYRPDNAVLVVAGDLEASALALVEEALGGIAPGADPRPAPPPPPALGELRRIERRQGEVGRLILALPAPAPDRPEHAELRMLAALVGLGRSSRLQRELVEEGELCLAFSAGLTDGALGSSFTLAAELLPGIDPGEVERRLFAALAALGTLPPSEPELDRARRLFASDWVYGQERIHQQALVTGQALAELGLEQPGRLLARALDATPDELATAARRWLVPEAGAVLGLSLPESAS